MAKEPVPEPIINYSAEQLITLVFSNSKEKATTHVAPMDIADVRTILLSKTHNFPFDAMKVFGPNGKIMEVREWVALKKDMYLEKWRQNSFWFGSDGSHHSMNGQIHTLEFMAVVPYYGPELFSAALRALVPGLIQECITDPAPESTVNMSHEGDISLSFKNGEDTLVAQVAPMSIADAKAILLSRTHNFPGDHMMVVGPDEKVMKVKQWVELNEVKWLDKWRQNSTWIGSDGKHTPMTGPRRTLEFVSVVPILGPEILATALRALVPGLILELHKK